MVVRVAVADGRPVVIVSCQRSDMSASRRAAFVELLRRHDQAVHAYLACRSGRCDADDLLGEVWLRAFEGRACHAGRWPDARPWLCGIARNVLRSHWRRLGRRQLSADPVSSDPWPEVDARIDAAAQVAALRRALAALAPADREGLLLVTWEGRLQPRSQWPSGSRKVLRAAGCTGLAHPRLSRLALPAAGVMATSRDRTRRGSRVRRGTPITRRTAAHRRCHMSRR